MVYIWRGSRENSHFNMAVCRVCNVECQRL